MHLETFASDKDFMTPSNTELCHPLFKKLRLNVYDISLGVAVKVFPERPE